MSFQMTALRFTKTAKIEDAIVSVSKIISDLQNVPKKELANMKSKIDEMSNDVAISLDDAKFLVKVLNEDKSKDSKQETSYVFDLLQGSEPCKPKPKISKNPEFQKYLEKLRKKHAQNEYNNMISHSVFSKKDKVPSMFGGQNRFAKNHPNLSRSQQESIAVAFSQISQSFYLIIVLVGSFLVFYYLSYHFFNVSQGWQIVSGCIGLLLGMFLDIALVIARSEGEERRAKTKNPYLKGSSTDRYNQRQIDKLNEKQRKELSQIQKHLKDKAKEKTNNTAPS